jgi:hypothetical protein
MSYDIAVDVCNAGGDAMCGLLDAGAGEPSLEFREADDDVLMVIGLNATRAIAAFSNRVGTFGNPTTGGGSWTAFSQLPSASGTLSYVAVLDGNGIEKWKLTCGTAGSGAEVIVDSLSLDTAIALTISVAPTMTMPAG